MQHHVAVYRLRLTGGSCGHAIPTLADHRTPTQRHELAVLLGLPMSRIRVVPTEVSGAFGGKETVRVSALCVALSRQAGLPVRIAFSREEVIRATGPATPRGVQQA